MMRYLRIVPPLALSCALAAAAAPAAMAQSGDARALTDTLARLERQLQALERTVYQGAAPPAPDTSAAAPAAAPSGAISNIQIATDALEEQMRRLTGQVEQASFQVRQMNQRMDRLVADVDFRLRALEKGAPAAKPGDAGAPPTAPSVPEAPGEVTVEPPSGPGTPQVIGTLTENQLRAAGVEPEAEPDADGAGAPEETQTASAPPAEAAPEPSPAALPPGNPREQYDYAYRFLLQRDFESAEAALTAFVAANPEDTLAGNAQYWLGETYYVRGDFTTAARSFAEGFQRYPDSAKAPDNLLKLGMSLARLDQSDDACITLKKLRIEYPDAPSSIAQRADREIGRLKCE